MHGQARPAAGGKAKVHRFRLPLLLGALILLVGCSPLQILGFIFAPDPSEPPKCNLVIPGKESKVVLLCTHADQAPTDPRLMRVDWDLGWRLTQLLEERFKENKDRVKIVPPNQVKNYMNKHPRWRDLPPQEIGKDFDADWVVNLEINSIGLYDRNRNFFYHASADIMVTVTDAHKPVGEGEVFSEPYQIEYPKSPMEVTDVNPTKFKAMFIDHIAKDLLLWLATHPPRDKCDGEWGSGQ
jgi:hypothetical protein